MYFLQQICPTSQSSVTYWVRSVQNPKPLGAISHSNYCRIILKYIKLNKKYFWKQDCPGNNKLIDSRLPYDWVTFLDRKKGSGVGKMKLIYKGGWTGHHLSVMPFKQLQSVNWVRLTVVGCCDLLRTRLLTIRISQSSHCTGGKHFVQN